MTETTSIQHLTRERHTYAPVAKQPGLATFIGQAAIGSFCGTFVVMVSRMLIVYRPHNDLFVLYVPILLGLGLAIGVLAGLLIWAGTRQANGELLGITRSLIGVLVNGLAWFALWYFLFGENVPSKEQFWLLTAVVFSGTTIGMLTGSRLRPWREMVRAGWHVAGTRRRP